MKLPFSKKNKEKININLPEDPSPSLNTANDDEIYYERADYQGSKYNLDDCFDQKTKQERILESIQAFERKAGSLLHKYYFLKLFGRAALRNSSYNEQTLYLDKQINRFKKNADDLRKRTDVLKYVKDVENLELEDVFLKINDTFDFYRDLDNTLNRYQNTFYPRLKMASFSICHDMTYQEIESLLKSINEMLEGYKNIQEAYDYICYNSGELIINTIQSLVNSLANSNNKHYEAYNFAYFLNSDFVMVMSFSEWVELFTKILYVKRTAKDVELFDYLQFKNYYQELEKRYLIMLIYNEMNQK
ncbi:MAG: hypothetical protein GX661_03710 [Acholeplasmataceae bacterium]|nr:hypothetical protein [Acholeplasmataceae bacterium]